MRRQGDKCASQGSPGSSAPAAHPSLLLRSSKVTPEVQHHVPETALKCSGRKRGQQKVQASFLPLNPTQLRCLPRSRLYKLRSPHGGTIDGSAAQSRWRRLQRPVPAAAGPGTSARVLPPRSPYKPWGSTHAPEHWRISAPEVPKKAPSEQERSDRVLPLLFCSLSLTPDSTQWQSWPQLQGKSRAFTVSRHVLLLCFCCQ